MENKSNLFLKVTGILLIIGGGISIIAGIIVALGLGTLAAGASALGVDTFSGLLIFAAILVLASGAFELVAGILGVKNAAKPEKAGSCIVFGFIVLALSILGDILTVVAGDSLSAVTIITGIVLPVMYLIGAFQSKSKA
jgi:FtsH-binding integral membrane protein